MTKPFYIYIYCKFTVKYKNVKFYILDIDDDGSHPSSQSARRARAYDSEDVFDDEEMCPHLMDEVNGDARWSP